MDAESAIMGRCSVREFTGKQVPMPDLEKMVRAGMAAPSAVNLQPWAFIIVTERGQLDKLCSVLPYAKMLASSGAAVVVCGVPGNDQITPNYWVMDCSAATENILIMCHALGYGAVWTAVHPDPQKVKEVKKILEIPGNAIPLNVIPVGVPAGKNVPKDKFKKERVHYEKW